MIQCTHTPCNWPMFKNIDGFLSLSNMLHLNKVILKIYTVSYCTDYCKKKLIQGFPNSYTKSPLWGFIVLVFAPLPSKTPTGDDIVLFGKP